ncbi:MAG TPA: hypothetical protein VNP98_03975 [Chthoniobacterales bacterium]|nr:hypothetical protein [Chthoniobacterales bacterium]
MNNKLMAMAIVFGLSVIAVAKFSAALEKLASFIPPPPVIETPVKPDVTPVGPVWVESVKSKKYSDGRYFDFDAEMLDKLLGRTDWDKRVYLVSKRPDTGFRRAVLRHSPSAEHGTAFGRLLPRGKRGDWKAGESFYVVPKDLGPWNPKEQ